MELSHTPLSEALSPIDILATAATFGAQNSPRAKMMPLLRELPLVRTPAPSDGNLLGKPLQPDYLQFAPFDEDLIGMDMSRNTCVYMVLRAKHHFQQRNLLRILQDALKDLEGACAANHFRLYPHDSTSRNWKARHMGVWARFSAQAYPISGMEKTFMQAFLEAIRPFGQYIDGLLKQHFLPFYQQLDLCRKSIPETLRCGCI